jgi:signal transduction histidine kinase
MARDVTRPAPRGAFARRVISARSRYSMRLRVFVAVTAAALAPQLLVLAWSLVDRPVPGRAWGDVRDAADAAVKALDAARGLHGARGALARIADAERVRLRVVADDGALLFDADRDDPIDPLHPFEAFFFGADAVTAADVDAALGPLPERSEIAAARAHGVHVGCDRFEPVVCQGARAVDAGGARVVVHAQKSSARAVQAVYLLRRQLSRLALVTLPLALALGLYAASRVSRPIERLRRQALARAHEARPEAELVGQDDEVGDLAAAFNAMLGALEARRAENEAFIADLVHEMKSPVAAVRATAEALEQPSDDRARAERLARVLGASAKKLDRLVTDFLELARAEAGLPNEEAAPIDATALVRGLVAHLREDERFEGLTVDVSDVPSVAIYGVPHRVEACLRELLENAASFAGRGGRVRVTVMVRRAGDVGGSDAAGSDGGGGEGRSEGREAVVVLVEDSGPGIVPEELPKVFRRFYTTRGEARGTGLGLALVRAVVEAHGGRVSARASELGGAAFEVRLPSAAPRP